MSRVERHVWEPQVANARPGVFPLRPVSDAPADAVRTSWQALLPGQSVPLVWEEIHDGCIQDDQ